MHRHSPNRSQRSKGLKFRQVLQICVLVAVCFWLIYQFKHSFDKKKAFEESDANRILKTDSESMKFGGRKDLQDPLKGNTLTVGKKDEEETEEENGVEEDETKHEVNGGEDDSKHEEIAEEEDSKPEENGEEDESKTEENEEDDDSKHGENGEVDNKNERTEQEPEEDNNNEEKEDEDERGGGDEEIDEHEQEKTNMEIEVDALDEDRDKVDSNKNDANRSKDKEAQKEDVSHVEDHDHEAREEQYKGDDASSAVTHDSESAETEREILQNHVDNTERNNLGDGTVAADSKVATIDQNSRALAKETSVITSVPIKEEDDKIVSTKQDEKADNQEEMGNELTKKSIETNGTPMTNSTETKQDGDQGKTSTNLSVIVLSESNPTNTQNLETVQGKSSNSSTTSETKVSEKQNTGANKDENQNESSDPKKETGENETGEENLRNHDPIDDSDSSIYLEKNARTDHDTLSDMKTEPGNYEEIAAE